jgi:hypothetical protein
VARAHGVAPSFTYSRALRGFAGYIPEARLEALRSDPSVAYIEAAASARR